jgi:chromosome segregation ATPase
MFRRILVTGIAMFGSTFVAPAVAQPQRSTAPPGWSYLKDKAERLLAERKRLDARADDLKQCAQALAREGEAIDNLRPRVKGAAVAKFNARVRNYNTQVQKYTSAKQKLDLDIFDWEVRVSSLRGEYERALARQNSQNGSSGDADLVFREPPKTKK